MKAVKRKLSTPLRSLVLIPLLLISGWFSTVVLAEIEIHQFKDSQIEARFLRLSDELRCPKCQNTNLSGSNAPIAKDLRDQLIRLLKEGKSDQQIEQYMLDRYGDFVLYRPQFKQSTWVLWLGPLAVLLAGFVLISRIVAKRSVERLAASVEDAETDTKHPSVRQGGSHVTDSLSISEKNRLDQLMSDTSLRKTPVDQNKS
ncbi:MAG: cytochrome c-type biogenesis protein CcmH [Pseudomonadales bacterium]|nr:cytochrome c-type biogenesis protein CcmH [Pseudomonadales bacterium]